MYIAVFVLVFILPDANTQVSLGDSESTSTALVSINLQILMFGSAYINTGKAFFYILNIVTYKLVCIIVI